MNKGFLIGIRQKIWHKKPIRNEQRAILMLKILLTFSLLLDLIFLLLKVFEVPVYTTQIAMEHNYFISDSANLNISIIRNYDRQNRITEGSDHIVSGFSRPGGIFVVGELIPQYSSKEEIDRVKKKWDNAFAKTFLDSCNKYNIALNNIGEIAHVSIKSTSRQYLYLNRKFKGPTFLKLITNSDSLICLNGKDYDIRRLYLYLDDTPVNKNNLFNYYSAVSNKDTLCPINIAYNSHSFDSPDSYRAFITAEDVSKATESIKFKGLSSYHIKKLTIDYLGAVNFGVLNPCPDSLTISSIVYTTPDKIENIALNGLKYHIDFPDMYNIQEIRTTALIMGITLLVGVLFDLFYRFLFTWERLHLFWHNHPRFCTILIALASILMIIYILFYAERTSIIPI